MTTLHFPTIFAMTDFARQCTNTRFRVIGGRDVIEGTWGGKPVQLVRSPGSQGVTA